MLYLFIDQTIGLLRIEKYAVFIAVGIYLAFYFAMYLLRSIAVYRLAKNAGVKGQVLAWIPLLWIYPFIMLVKEDRFFGVPFKKVAVLLTVLFSVGELLSLGYQVLSNLPIFINWINGVDVYLFGAPVGSAQYTLGMMGEAVWFGEGCTMVYSNPILIKAILEIAVIFIDLFSLVSSVILVFSYFSVFRKYWPEHYVLASILSLWIFPIMMFVIRNKKPVDYMEFLRNRYGSYYANQNPNYQQRQNNGQGRNPYEKQREETPFSDFENKGHQKVEEPFSEFDTDDNE